MGDVTTTIYDGPAVIATDSGDLEVSIALDVESEPHPHTGEPVRRWSGSFQASEYYSAGECIVRLPGGGEGRGFLYMESRADDVASYGVAGNGPPPARP